MNCTDQRIINVCKSLFEFLKSDKTSEIIHGKEINKTHRGKATFCDITLGFVSLRMIYLPYTSNGAESSGSNEGASVAITLPFQDNEDSNKLEIKCYYSERGSQVRLTVNAPDMYRSSTQGAKRITVPLQVSTSDPLS